MSEKRTDKPVVAAFDFDGTLTRRDTMFPFLLHVVGWSVFIRHLFMLAPTLLGYGLGLIRNDIAKERVFTRFLADMRIVELKLKAEQFSLLVLPKLLRPEAMQRFKWHKEQRHRCVVISASLALYVHHWAINAGFDDVIATHLDMRKDGSITGNLSGGNCFGSEKVRRLEGLLESREHYILYAYGDSRGDKELMSFADHPYYRRFPKL